MAVGLLINMTKSATHSIAKANSLISLLEVLFKIRQPLPFGVEEAVRRGLGFGANFSSLQSISTQAMSNSPLSPGSLPQNSTHPAEDEDYKMVDADEDDEEEVQEPGSQGSTAQQDTRAPREGRKEKDLNAFLNSMDKYAPIVRH